MMLPEVSCLTLKEAVSAFMITSYVFLYTKLTCDLLLIKLLVQGTLSEIGKTIESLQFLTILCDIMLRAEDIGVSCLPFTGVQIVLTELLLDFYAILTSLSRDLQTLCTSGLCFKFPFEDGGVSKLRDDNGFFKFVCDKRVSKVPKTSRSWFLLTVGVPFYFLIVLNF